MANVSQTEEEIEINIRLNRSSSKQPDVTLFKNFIKFNCHPTYFEGFLCGDIIEEDSCCRMCARNVKITLKKKDAGIWERIFEDLSKEETLNRKKEIVELMQVDAQEKEKEKVRLFEEKRRAEVQKVINRESAVRENIESLEKEICKEETTFEEVNLEPVQMPQQIKRTINVRKSGKIDITFSDFSRRTPKRESQK